MSRAEEITSEVRRLVLTCRAMEAQLQQSISKKAHQEVVAKMQAIIDGLTAESERTKTELHKTLSLNETIGSLGRQISSLTETVTRQGETIASQGKVIEGQNSTIDALSGRLSQSTVPVLLYNQTLSKVEELQEKIRCMVDKVDFVAMQKKHDDLSETIKSMVPKADYLALQAQFSSLVPRESFEELQRTLSRYVPREQLLTSENRVQELEARLANSVPRVDYEELTARIASLTKEATSMSMQLDHVASHEEMVEMHLVSQFEPVSKTQAPTTTPPTTPTVVEAATAAPPTPVAVAPTQPPTTQLTLLAPELNEPQPSHTEPMTTMNSVAQESTQAQESVQVLAEPQAVAQALEPASVQVAEVKQVEAQLLQTPTTTTDMNTATLSTPEATTPSPEPSRPEITEIQSQLSAIKAAVDSGETKLTEPERTTDISHGFVFQNTSLCATSGLEFLQDLEKAPIESVEYHARNGDFETWFKNVLADETSADSLKSIRESNCMGEELRTRIVAVIAPRLKA